MGFSLALCLLFSLLPHLLKLPIIFTGYISLLVVWFTLHSFKGYKLPNKFIRLIFFVSALVLIFINFGIDFSQSMSVTLLVLMLCLKLFEIKNVMDRRNIFLIIYLCLFLIGSHFLSSQSIFMMIYNIVLLLSLSILLAAYNRQPQKLLPFKTLIRPPVAILIQAIPLTIIFFVFFPRISEPLWSLPDSNASSRTGLSDTMYPGRITELSDDSSVVFRVLFHGKVPSSQNLYWRGPVMSKTDGYTWSRYANQSNKRKTNDIFYEAGKVEYTVTLEPQQQRWLFALDMPKSLPIDGYFSNDYQIITERKQLQVKRYRLTSFTKYTLPNLSKVERARTLKLPKNANPRTLELGEKWRAKFTSAEDIVEKAFTYFSQQPFYYTRQPSAMRDDPIDQFLFDYKEGFCEHYATAFVYLMRAAGLPARVVTGYQGVEKNGVGDYYIVRQSNAHAWVEVWLEDKGWWRVDPTTAVPPERIKADILNRQSRQLTFMNLNLPKLGLQKQNLFQDGFTFLKDNIDNMRYFWNEWVVGFDLLKQKSIMSLIGLSADIKNLVSLMVGLGLFVILLLSFYWYVQAKKINDPIRRAYQRFIHKLEKHDLTIPDYLGPVEVQQLAIQYFPKHKQIIKEIINSYIALRYAKNTKQVKPEDLIHKVHQLKI